GRGQERDLAEPFDRRRRGEVALDDGVEPGARATAEGAFAGPPFRLRPARRGVGLVLLLQRLAGAPAGVGDVRVRRAAGDALPVRRGHVADVGDVVLERFRAALVAALAAGDRVP